MDCGYESPKHYQHINYAFLDLQQLLQVAGWDIFFEHTSVAISDLELKEDDIQKDKRLLARRWGKRLEEYAKKEYIVDDINVMYRMECGTSGGNIPSLL